jgi:acetyltransferase-like isoleucine patch superfamily enzyme
MVDVKQRLYRRLAVHPRVEVGERFHVGLGTRVWAPNKLTIGDDVYIGKYASIEVDGVIGSQVLIANNVGLIGRRDHNFRQIGTGVRSATWVGDDESLSVPLSVGSDCWIGFGAIVLSGVQIGDHAVVAAGSVVTSSVPSNSIVRGNPAVRIGERFDPDELVAHRMRLRAAGVPLAGDSA